jgi:DNA-binding NarL/FixJ family response regulator
MSPRVAYTTTADGVRIAYSVVGSGPPLVRVTQARWDHLEGWWGVPAFREMAEGLAAEYSLVLYDARGTGLSDREAADYTLETQLLDLHAVVDAAGLDHFVLIGWQMGSPAAIAAAWRWPDSVAGLVLVNPISSGREFLEVPEVRARQAYRAIGEPVWREYRMLQARAIVGDADPELLQRIVDLMGRSTTPEVIRRHAEQHGRINVTPLLSQLHLPALAIVSESCPWRALSSEVARRVPHCRTVLQGGGPLLWLDRVSVEAVTAFLRTAASDLPAGPERNESLSSRELEVLALMAAGESNAAIAESLTISENTVLHHVSSVLRKLGARNRAHAVSVAHRAGLIR